jgi:hypothetical protein
LTISFVLCRDLHEEHGWCVTILSRS